MGLLNQIFGSKSGNPSLNELLAEANDDYWQFDLESSDVGKKIFALSREDQCIFVLDAIKYIRFDGVSQKARQQAVLCQQVAYQLLNKHLPFSHAQLITLLEWLADFEQMYQPPLSNVIKQIKHYLKNNQLTPQVSKAVENVINQVSSSSYSNPTLRRQIAQLNKLAAIETYTLPILAGEAWSDVAIAAVQQQSKAQQSAWIQLLDHAQSASGGQPSKKWLEKAQNLLDAVTYEQFKDNVLIWFPLVDKPPTIQRDPVAWGADPNLLIDNSNADVLKGLAWLCAYREDGEIARALTILALSAYRKVPGVGPRCLRVGNACIWALGNIPGQVGIEQLMLLKVKAKFSTAQKGIEKALVTVAKREELPREELEELAVPTYSLTDVGQGEETFGDYTAVLQVTGTSSTQLSWRKPDGKPQKSVPKAVKENFAEQLKSLKQRAKDIQKMLPAQRDRIENFYLAEKAWDYATWSQRYLNHPLVGTIARRLLWRFANDESEATAVWYEGQLVTNSGEPVEWLNEQTKVILWHPLQEAAETVLAWRQWLEAHQIQQPFKQAHREIYLLTDAERQTETYSNRFAAHILRQHQFHSLCAVRGWRNKLRLLVDDEYPPAMRELLHWNLRAEFWIEGIGEDFGADTTEAGTYHYVATDQVRFYALGSVHNYAHAGGGGYRARYREDNQENAPLPLSEIPALVFSEIMRDVDLFVGVASVGNDPTWVDGRSEGHYIDYWHSYSIGDLSQTAQTRKAVLETILPKLKVAEQCTLKGRFVEVEGEYHTYKIHLGSGNILLSSSGQYLCIVRGSNRGKSASSKMFLPFEGDRMLSIILSKILLLAHDTEIKDPTILRQIKGTTRG
ncbi:DUF4132 domain-containing protein [Candidatus Leptofilum sp.]|uniref:DUF4132 domain-containing protein n=1 Tax=Candidatus Leptofilum sp. TaxID=3241576 RepID=UPI003B58D152